jgi:hypothetical protein
MRIKIMALGVALILAKGAWAASDVSCEHSEKLIAKTSELNTDEMLDLINKCNDEARDCLAGETDSSSKQAEAIQNTVIVLNQIAYNKGQQSEASLSAKK